MILTFKHQSFTKIAPNVYCSDNIHRYGNDYTIVQNRYDYQSKSIISVPYPICQFSGGKEFWIHHFMKFKYFKSTTACNKLNLSFVSPQKWNDPYESLFLLNEKTNDPFFVRCACFAFDMQYCEEAMWLRSQQPNSYVFEDKTICVSFCFEKLIELLSDHATSFNSDNLQGQLTFYISIVDYSQSKNSLTKSNAKKAKSYTNVIDYINHLSLKRKAYYYENELRIFAVFNKMPSDFYYNVSFNFNNQLLRRILMPPLFPWGYDGNNYKSNQVANNSLLKHELSKIGITPSQSKLYDLS